MTEERIKEQANKLFDSQGISHDTSHKTIMDYYRVAIEYDYLQHEEDLSEFEIKRQRNAFEEAYEERVMASKRREYDRQKKMLKEIYEMPVFSPQFHWNQKYLSKKFENTVPYICLNDLLENKYAISAIPEDNTEMVMLVLERKMLVKEYDNLDELVEDGWRLC